MPMCQEGPLLEYGVCPSCGGQNIRKTGFYAQCCSMPNHPEVQSCGYFGPPEEFILQKKL